MAAGPSRPADHSTGGTRPGRPYSRCRRSCRYRSRRELGPYHPPGEQRTKNREQILIELVCSLCFVLCSSYALVTLHTNTLASWMLTFGSPTMAERLFTTPSSSACSGLISANSSGCSSANHGSQRLIEPLKWCSVRR